MNIEQINATLKNIFGDHCSYVCRRKEEIYTTTDGQPAIGFHIEGEYDDSLLFNFLARNLRHTQTDHPYYFSFYVKHKETDNMLHTFKINILPINSSISEEGEFPILHKENVR